MSVFTISRMPAQVNCYLYLLSLDSNFKTIPQLVASGKLNTSVVDTAVSRLLRAKFEMGLFETPYPAAPSNQWNNLIHTPENLQVARDLDRESIVLLENHNSTLPLRKSGSIAVIGPIAHGYMNVCISFPLWFQKWANHRAVWRLCRLQKPIQRSHASGWNQGRSR